MSRPATGDVRRGALVTACLLLAGACATDDGAAVETGADERASLDQEPDSSVPSDGRTSSTTERSAADPPSPSATSTDADSDEPGPAAPGTTPGQTTDDCWSSPPAEGDGIAFDHAAADLGLVEPLTGMHPHAVAAGDVDGDGWTDLFVGTFADRPPENYAVRGASGPSPDRLLLGGPDGFRVDESFPTQYARTSGAVFADLDGDGDLDLVAARNARGDDDITARPTAVFENATSGWVERATLAHGARARAVAAVDLDRDGTLDLVVASDRYGDASTMILRGDGAFGFEDVTGQWGVPDDLTGLAVATVDLDGDGWLDLVVNGDRRVLLGGPDGWAMSEVPELEWEVFGEEDLPAGIAVGDLDGDERPDLVLGHHFNSTIDAGTRVPVRVVLNRSVDGRVAFEDVTERSGSPGLWTKSPHVALADVDNDGRADIVTSAATDDDLPFVLRNVSEGPGELRFVPVGEPGAGEYFVTGAVTDLDRDGRVDVFLVAWEPDRESVLARNRSASGAWLEVDVTGVAVGDRLEVVDPATGDAIAHRWVESTTGYAAGASPVVHVGLGGERDAVTVRAWSEGGPVEFVASPNSRVTLDGC